MVKDSHPQLLSREQRFEVFSLDEQTACYTCHLGCLGLGYLIITYIIEQDIVCFDYMSMSKF